MTRLMRTWAAALAILALMVGQAAPALAQNAPSYSSASGVKVPASGFVIVNSDGTLCSFRAGGNCASSTTGGSATPFLSLGNTTLAMTSSSARTPLPTSDIVVEVYNAGPTAADVAIGNSAVTTSNTPTVHVPAASLVGIPNPSGATHIAALLASGTGTLYVASGTGSLQGFGTGSGTSAVVTFGAGATDGTTQRIVLASDPDLRPASVNITAADVGSTSTAGMNSVNLITGSATAGSTASQAINGHSSAAITVTAASGFTGIVEASGDGGTTWTAQSGLQRGYAVTLSTITGNGIFSFDVTSMTNLRVRGTAGTATVKMAFSGAAGMTKILNPMGVIDTTGARIDPMPKTGGSVTASVVTPTDRGGTITTGGTAQTAIASNASRKSGYIQNPCTATEDLFVSTTTTATTTGASDDADLAPCGAFSLVTPGGVIQTAVSVIAATTGHRWIAKEAQ